MNNQMKMNNQMGMKNQMGMNNQMGIMPNEFSMANLIIDNTTLRIQNIVKPYEDRIKELEKLIRKKDLQIAVLQEKLYFKNQNFLNPFFLTLIIQIKIG